MNTMRLLLILLFLTYPFDAFQVFAFAGYGVKYVDISLFLFYGLLMKKIIWDGVPLRFNPHITLKILSVFLLAIIISGIMPLYYGESAMILQYIKTTAHFFYIVLFVFAAILYPFKNEDWSVVIKILLIFALFINIFGIYQVFARAFDLPFAWLTLTNVSLTARGALGTDEVQQLSLQFSNLFRATSIFSEPSMLAAFNTLMLVFIIVPFVQKNKPFIENKLLLTITFIMLLAGTVATFSLTAFIALFGVTFAVVVFEKSRNLKKTLIASVIVAFVVLIGDYYVEKYTETSPVGLFTSRITGILSENQDISKQVSGESFVYRKFIMDTSIDIWRKHPIIGCGLGNFTFHQNVEVYYAQDALWGTLSETGLLGNISFLAFWLSLFITIYFYRKKGMAEAVNQDGQRLFGLAPYILIQLFFVNFTTTNYLVYANLWFFIAIVLFILNQIEMKHSTGNISIIIMQKPLKYYISMALNKGKEKNE